MTTDPQYQLATDPTSFADVEAVRFKRLTPNVELPFYATPQSAGMDIRADFSAFRDGDGKVVEEIVLQPGGRALVPTGLSVQLPPGYELQVRPRSGLALKKGLTVLNTPGTIDADYRGEIGVLLINHGHDPVEIVQGERIAQLVLAKYERLHVLEVTTLNETDRKGGFGSTGVK